MAVISEKRKTAICKWDLICILPFHVFAYCGHVFLSKSMKFTVTAYFTLRNCSKTSVLTIFQFLGHFSTFEHFNAIFEPHRPIQNCSRFTQISITVGTLCFCKKKNPKYFIWYHFFRKNSCFWHKKPFLFFLLEIGQNKYQILYLHTF